MKYSNEVKEYWDGIGSEYQNFWHSPSQLQMSNLETNYISSFINSKKCSVFDYGIGNGRIIDVILSKTDAGSQIYGTDISDSMVSYCKTKFVNEKRVKIYPVESIFSQVGDILFDVVTSIRVLKYNTDWVEHLKRLAKSTKLGGLLIVTMPNPVSTTIIYRPRKTYIKKTAVEMTKVFNECGFEVLDIRGFARIPDLFYRIDSSLISRIVCTFEKFFNVILGTTLFQKELFYVVKKINITHE